MGCYTVFLQHIEKVTADQVIGDSLAGNLSLFHTIESGGIVLKKLDDQFGILGGIDYLGFTFI
jgi:hypothetical protein